MKLRNTGRIAVAGLAIAAALSLSACGSDDDSKPAKKSATTTTSETAAAQVPAPTKELFQDHLNKALDPAYPAAQKAKWIQGFENQPALVDSLAKKFTESKGAVTINEVVYTSGPKAQGKGTFAVGGNPPQQQEVPFVFENGEWKVEKLYACQLIKLASIPDVPAGLCPQ